MGEGTRTSSTALSDGNDPQQIRHQIEETRGQLGETVATLAEKTNVKAQATRKAEETKASISQTVSQKKDELFKGVRRASPQAATSATSRLSATSRENPMPFVAGGAFVTGLIVGVAANRKR